MQITRCFFVGAPLYMPRTNLDDRRSDKNKLAVSGAVDAKLPPAAAAAMA